MQNNTKEISPTILRNILENLSTLDLMNIKYITSEILENRGWSNLEEMEDKK